MNNVTYDRSSFFINGERIWLVCGEMHYFRTPAELWRDRLVKAKRAGLNCISTYMAWNLHEPEEGKFDFEGDRDVAAFIRLAGELGLYVILRPGPYICSEWDFGGLPAWLTSIDDLYYRTNHPVYTRYYRRYFGRILPELACLDAAHGGCIILIQNENEHHMPCVPGRTEHFKDISRCFREAGFKIPIVNCNRLFEGPTEAGTMECANTWDDPVGDLAALRQCQPDAPLLVAEFWSGGVDSWGRKHMKKDHRAVARKAAEITGCGSQLSYYMWHGGTNFGFWGGRLQYDHFYHMITSYDLDAPLAEGGELTEKYYATRLVNMLANHMGRYLAGSMLESQGTEDDGRLRVLKLAGWEGNWTTVSNEGKGGIRSARVITEDGKMLKASLEPFGAVILPSRLRLTQDFTLDYTNLTPLGFFGGKLLVLHGSPGWDGIVSINHKESRIIVPQGKETRVVSYDGLLLAIVNTDVAKRCWWVEEQLVIGPDYVGEFPDDIVMPEEETEYCLISLAGEVTRKNIPVQNAETKELPVLKAWRLAHTCMEPLDDSLEWERIDGPCSLSKLGVQYGYGWYRVRLESDELRKTGLFLPECEDRATLYLNGRFIGVWGYGDGASRSPIPAELTKGINTITILADNLGRFNHSWKIGEQKGVYGHIYDTEPVAMSAPVINKGGYFTREMLQGLPGHRNEDDHIPELERLQLWTASMDFRLDRPVPIHVSYSGAKSVLIICNDNLAGFYENPGAGFADTVIKDSTREGVNTLKFLMWGDIGPEALKNVAVHRLKSPVSEGGTWEFRRWSNPAFNPDESAKPAEACEELRSSGKNMPAWYKNTFSAHGVSGPVYIKIGSLCKGQLYLNGYNIGRIWTIEPQDTYYLPECRIKEENELLLFDEAGREPADCSLEPQRTWLDSDTPEKVPDVL